MKVKNVKFSFTFDFSRQPNRYSNVNSIVWWIFCRLSDSLFGSFTVIHSDKEGFNVLGKCLLAFYFDGKYEVWIFVSRENETKPISWRVSWRFEVSYQASSQALHFFIIWKKQFQLNDWELQLAWGNSCPEVRMGFEPGATACKSNALTTGPHLLLYFLQLEICRWWW